MERYVTGHLLKFIYSYLPIAKVGESLYLRFPSVWQEFEIIMKKINGSLGFTLKKDEHSHRNHTVRALVKEPAISDGRIKPGDQIISVSLKISA